jgi:transcriptional regulator with XRE-family HTH domain
MTGLTQRDVAEACDVAPATVAAFERGERVPHRRTMRAMESALESHGVRFTATGVELVSK